MTGAEARLEKPAGLGKHGGRLWDLVIDDLQRGAVTSRPDTAALSVMCEWYEWYRKFSELMAQAVRNGELGDKETYRITIQVAMCWREAEKLMQQFGLTPVARARLRIQPSSKKRGVEARKR